jgi:hypothetical protein
MTRWAVLLAAMMVLGLASWSSGNMPPPPPPEPVNGVPVVNKGVSRQDHPQSPTVIRIGRESLAAINQAAGGNEAPGAAPAGAAPPKGGAHLGTIMSGIALAAALTVGGLTLVRRGRKGATLAGVIVALGAVTAVSLADVAPGRRTLPPVPEDRPAAPVDGPKVIVELVDGHGIEIKVSREDFGRLTR